MPATVSVKQWLAAKSKNSLTHPHRAHKDACGREVEVEKPQMPRIFDGKGNDEKKIKLKGRGVELLITQLYEDRACLWDAAHKNRIKRDKKEEEMGDFKKQKETAQID